MTSTFASVLKIFLQAVSMMISLLLMTVKIFLLLTVHVFFNKNGQKYTIQTS